MSSPTPPATIDLLVIGYGNTLRSDDAVGRRVAEAVAQLEVPGTVGLSCDLLLPELAEPVSRARRVVFVDATLDVSDSVGFEPLVPADSTQLMAHAADPRTLLAMAREVFGHAPCAWWLTIPVQNLEIGEGLSRKARRGFDAALTKIRSLLPQDPLPPGNQGSWPG